MATKQRSRVRRPSNRDRAQRYVEPVLDPDWQNPYAPSAQERQANLRAVRTFALRRTLAQSIVVGVVVLALLVGVVAMAWLPIVGLAVALGYFFFLRRSLARFATRGDALASAVLSVFKPGGTAKDRQRLTTVLDRLSATFGVDGVSAFIIEDPDYNAALVPNGAALSLFVTSAMMSDFDLIEIEGVVAHCLARHRLGLLNREAAASMITMSDEARRELAGAGNAYRADEVAAAAIRYPQGLAEALRKCSRHVASPSSFFSSAAFAQWRWIWFDVRSDRRASDMGDLDDVELRARALDEW
jgi:Zn-dependent protease with chaperone function